MRLHLQLALVFIIGFAGILPSTWAQSADAQTTPKQPTKAQGIPNQTMSKGEANLRPASPEGALKEFETVQSEVNALLKRLATDKDYATQVQKASDAANEDAVRGLLLKGGIKQGQIDELGLDATERRVKVKLCYRSICITITISTSAK